ncbi:MAG TPA: DUF402 domain-containing protein [Pyrinomonadaceae bacterium]|nr:DUF402 domain-containing protein [Pyrinomonadaceae bacterium]
MPAHQTVTVNSRKFDQTIRKSWTCEVIESSGPLLVLRGEFDEDISHPGLGELKRGTVSYEYYWLDRWYNVFRFHEPEGTFRNYYCNINMPPTFENSVLDYVDLDIDILVWNQGAPEVVDYVDFETNAIKYEYPHDVRQRVAQTIDELIGRIEARTFPFDYGFEAIKAFDTSTRTQEEF